MNFIFMFIQNYRNLTLLQYVVADNEVFISYSKLCSLRDVRTPELKENRGLSCICVFKQWQTLFNCCNHQWYLKHSNVISDHEPWKLLLRLCTAWNKITLYNQHRTTQGQITSAHTRSRTPNGFFFLSVACPLLCRHAWRHSTLDAWGGCHEQKQTCPERAACCHAAGLDVSHTRWGVWWFDVLWK